MKLRYTLLISLLFFGCALFSYTQNGFFGGIGSVGYTGSDVNNLELYGLDFNNKIGTYFSFFHVFPI